MKNFLGFLIVVAVIGFFTKPDLDEARAVYEGDNSFSKTVREDIFGETEIDDSIESFMSKALSAISGIELRMYVKDRYVYHEFYLVLSHEDEDTYLKGLYGIGAFTKVVEVNINLEEFEQIDDLSEFDDSVRLNF